MNRKLRVSCLAAATFLTSIVLAVAITSQYQPFTSGAPGTFDTTWTSSSGCFNTNVYCPTDTNVIKNALAIPGGGSVSNALSSDSGKVWTDFWTVPVKYSNGEYPVLETAATAQIYLNAQTNWVAFSGNGSGGYITNSLTATTTSGSNGYYRVSVLSDYGAKKYSLLINDNCIGTNLSFISTNTAVNTERWFIVTNLLGECLVDEYRFTTNVSGILTNPVSGGGISQSQALQYFGTVNNPVPVVTNFGVASSVGANAVKMGFVPQPEQKYVLLRGFNSTDMSGIDTVDVSNASAIIDTNALGSVSNQMFYKVLTVSKTDGSVTITNAETYAWFRQYVTKSNHWYYSGVPVIFGSPAANGLSNSAGRQFAGGLCAGQTGTGDVIVVGNSKYKLSPETNWVNNGTEPINVTNAQLSVGTGVMIKRLSGSVSSPIVVAGVWTNSITVNFTNGWNTLIWLFDRAAMGTEFPNNQTDKIRVMRADKSGNINAQTATRYTNIWEFVGGAGDIGASNYPQPGEGFLYYYSKSDTNLTFSR